MTADCEAERGGALPENLDISLLLIALLEHPAVTEEMFQEVLEIPRIKAYVGSIPDRPVWVEFANEVWNDFPKR